MFKNLRNYKPDAGAIEGGGTPAPAAGGSTGGGTETPEQKAEVAELQALIGKDAHNDVEKARLEVLKGKYDATPVGADGKPLTVEQVKAIKEIETKVNTILAKDEAARTPEENKFIEDNTEEEKVTKSIYEQVDELRGEAIEVEYGDVKPDSAEGILLREETIAERAAMGAENEIKAKFPRAYSLMVHLANGGKEEDFFKPQNQDFNKVTITNKADQENLVRTALALKGNSPVIIDAVLTTLKDKGTLEETAKSELEALQANQKQRDMEQQARVKQARAKEMQDMGALAQTLQTSITKGFDGITIPLEDRKNFEKFIGERINYSNGEFSVVSKLDPKELNKALKVAYFEFKGGDLKALAERSAKTMNARKIKNSLSFNVVPKGQGAPVKRNVPLSQL